MAPQPSQSNYSPKANQSNTAPNPARIKVIGVGGGGCNAISRMVRSGIQGVEFYAVNTDAQALLLIDAPNKVRIGDKLTRGLGCGGHPEVGTQAAMESQEEIREIVKGSDMVFVTAGMGGGTGTGACPVIAGVARESGALTIGAVTRPFNFEGNYRTRTAMDGIAKLQEKVDTLIVVPNDRLLTLCDHKSLAQDAFKLADDALRQGVQAVSEVITRPGEINLDFADVKAVMANAGPAWMSIGHGTGQNRAVDAARGAVSSPLLDVSIEGAKGVLFTVTGGRDLTLHEVNEAAEIIRQMVHPEANIIFGVVFDPEMEAEVSITLIATGFTSQTNTTPMSAPKVEELRQMLKGLGDEHALDVPAFMRRSTPPRPSIGRDISNRLSGQSSINKTSTSEYPNIKRISSRR